MKATKRISAIFLALVLALSLLPVSVFAAGSDYSTRLLVDKVADDKVDVKWMVQTSNGAVLKTTNSIIFKYDHTKYDMLTNDGTVITPKGMSENLFSHYKANYKQNVTVLDTPDLGIPVVFTPKKKARGHLFPFLCKLRITQNLSHIRMRPLLLSSI